MQPVKPETGKPTEKQIIFLNSLKNELSKYEIELSIPADLTKHEASLLIGKAKTLLKEAKWLTQFFGSWERAKEQHRHKVLHLQHQGQNFILVYRKMMGEKK